MNNINKNILKSIVLASIALNANAIENNIGFDLGLKSISHKDNGGSQVIPNRRAPSLNLSYTKGISDNFGVEFGLQYASKTKDSITGGDITEFGLHTYNYRLENKHKTKTSTYGANVNAVANFKLSDKFSVQPLIGLALLRNTTDVALIQREGREPIKAEVNKFNFKTSKNALVPRVGVGAKFALDKKYGLKARVIHENTARLSFKNIDNGGDIRKVNVKNSTTFSFGVYYNI